MTEAEKAEKLQLVPVHLENAVEDVLRQIDASLQSIEQAEPGVKESLLERQEMYGIHAYRYEILGDGSVIAIYAHEPDEVKIKAFDDMKEASRWSPREER